MEIEPATQLTLGVCEDNNEMLPEGTVLLYSAAEAGNWNLVKDLIYDSVVSVDDVCQSFLLQKLASATEVRRQAVQDILKKLFLSEADTSSLNAAARDAILKAARGDNWDIFLLFVTIAKNILEDEATLAAVTQAMVASQTLKEKPFLHVDVFIAVWRHSKQNILSTNDKSVQNTLVQLAAELKMWSRVCEILVVRPDLNALDRDGLSVLHRLVMCPDSRFDYLLPVLLEQGADARLKTSRGNTALHLAAKHQKVLQCLRCSRQFYNSGSYECKHPRSKDGDKYQIQRDGSKSRAVRKLIKSRGSTDIRNGGGNTAAILAAKNDNWEFVRLLLEEGARADLTDRYQRSMLHVLAVSEASLDAEKYETLVTLSVNRGAQVNGADLEGSSAAHLSVKSKNWTLLKLLLRFGASPELKDSDGYSVLHRLAMTESEHAAEVAKLFSILAQRGADIDLLCPAGDTVLHVAARLQNWTLVKHLVHLGADVSLCNRKGFTPVHLLSVSDLPSHDTVLGTPEVLSVFLDKGADLEIRCCSGDTALHLAARRENWSMAKCLIQRGANSHEPDSEGFHVVERLVQCGTDTVETKALFSLLHTGAAKSGKGPDAASLVQLAAKHEKWAIVDHLLKHHGGDVNIPDREGFSVVHRMAASRGRTFKEGWNCGYCRSVLGKSRTLYRHEIAFLVHRAAAAGNVDVVDVLLDGFDDVNATDREGYTVLHRVARCCVSTAATIIRCLVDKGADVEQQCPMGNSALHLAAKSSNWLSVHQLLNCGVRACTLDSEGASVLHRLMAQPRLQCERCVQGPVIRSPVFLLAAILSRGASLVQGDLHNNSPLHLSVKHEHWDMVAELSVRGASFSERDCRGCTVLHTIAKRCNSSQGDPSTLKPTCSKSNFSSSFQTQDGDGLWKTTCAENNCVTCFLDTFHQNQFLFTRLAELGINHLNVCDRIVDSTELIDCLDPDGNTALLLSAKYNNWDITERLLLKGADIRLVDRTGISLLHILATVKPASNSPSQDMRKRILELVISRGSEVTARDPEGNTPIQLAAKHGNMEMVERLLDFEQNVNEADSEGFPLLSRVAMTSCPRCDVVAELLVEKGAEVNITRPDGEIPWLLSVLSRNWSVTSLLWSSTSSDSADVALQAQHLILHRLVEDHSAETRLSDLIFETVSRKSSTLMDRNSEGASVLQLAFAKKKWDLVRLLLSDEAISDPEPLTGDSIFHALAECAVQGASPDWILGLIADTPALNLNLRDDDGNTPLHILAKSSQWKLFERFVELGADVSIPDREGWTVIHTMAMSTAGCGDLPEVLDIFAKNGGDLNTVGSGGKDAVRLTLEKKNWTFFWNLLHQGAHCDWTEIDKASLFQNVFQFPKHADEEKVKDIVMSFTENCFRPASSNEAETMPLTQNFFENCVLSSNWTVAKVLLECTGDIDIHKLCNGKPLLHAMVSSHKEQDHVTWLCLLDALLDRGLDINCRDKYGRTVLMKHNVLRSLARTENNPNALIKILLNRGAKPLLVDNGGNSLLTEVMKIYDRFSLKRVVWLLQQGVISDRNQLEEAEVNDSMIAAGESSVSSLKEEIGKVDTAVQTILIECGAISNREAFLLSTDYRTKEIQTEGGDNEVPQLCKMLAGAATHPRSLTSLCRLSVVRSIPCCQDRKDKVMTLPVPLKVQRYLLFEDLLTDLGVDLEDERWNLPSPYLLEDDDDSDSDEDEDDYYDFFDSSFDEMDDIYFHL